jgi:rRNA maturation endonuclease Nob1
LIGVFYICLGVATTIGIISYAYEFKKLVKMKPKSEKEIIMRNYQIKVSCERCGIKLDSDSIFCHECGIRLKNYILNRIA